MTEVWRTWRSPESWRCSDLQTPTVAACLRGSVLWVLSSVKLEHTTQLSQLLPMLKKGSVCTWGSPGSGSVCVRGSPGPILALCVPQVLQALFWLCVRGSPGPLLAVCVCQGFSRSSFGSMCTWGSPGSGSVCVRGSPGPVLALCVPEVLQSHVLAQFSMQFPDLQSDQSQQDV